MTMEFLHVPPAPLSDDATQHMVRMRDGVRLATDVYLAGDQPGPTILIRLPYDKVGSYTFIPLIAAYFVRHGYHVVAQDVRGKFRSEGEALLFVNEAVDGYDAIEWITHQAFSDGIVGMWGDSYYGYTQWAAVSTQHPALRAISPRVTGTRLGELPSNEDGGATRDVEMAVALLYPCTFFHSNDVYLWEPDWDRRPLVDNIEEFFETVGSRSISFDQWYPHQVRLRRFPAGHPVDARPVPVLMTIGWWDNCAPWQWSDHWKLVEHQGWRESEYLLIESIDHENNNLLNPRGEVPTPEELEEMLPEYLDPSIEFFDVFLRDRAPSTSIPKVRWNLAHTEGFQVSDQWPPADVVTRTWYLDADRLSESIAAAGELTWVHDPTDLVPSPAKNAFAFLGEQPDERDWAARKDVLVFDADPVTDPTDLVGGVVLNATVASTGPSMDVFARVLDVAPDGAAHLVARGQVHVKDATVRTDAAIDLGQIGYRLAAGHRLRLHIASSDYPEFIPQSGTGENFWSATEFASNTQTLVVGGDVGAHLVIGAVRTLSP